MSKSAKTTHAYQAGAIIAIELPDKRFAYGRLFNDPWIGIFDRITDQLGDLKSLIGSSMSFYCSTNLRALKAAGWPVIGQMPFPSADEAWPPPQATMYSWNTNWWTTGEPKVTHKGQIRSASLDEVASLDIATANPKAEGVVHMIMERLVQGNHDRYRVRPQ